MFNLIVSMAGHFRRNESGVVLVLFLALSLPLLMLIAVGIDVGQFLVMKRQLQGAVDSAALNLGTKTSLSDAEAQSLAQSVIQANYPATSIGTVTSIGVTMSADQKTFQVTAQASMNTTFLKLAGYNALPVTVSATAAQSISYFNIYTLVDMSGSLGIAADRANRLALQALTKPYTKDSHSPNGCEFACHYVDGAVKLPGGVTAYNFARAHGISLREDVLNAAFSNFVTQIFTTNPNSSVQRQVDVIGFGGDPSPTSQPTMIQDLTNGPTNDQSVAANALSTYNGSRWGGQFRWVLPMVAKLMGPQGNGYTANTPLMMLVMITDGVEDDRANYIRPGPVDMPINFNNNPQTPTQNCEAIKNSGITLAVIDVQYVDSSNSYWFNYWLMPFINLWNSTIYGEISPALQACASPGWYFVATDTDQINNALSQLLNQINSTSLRLSK